MKELTLDAIFTVVGLIVLTTLTGPAGSVPFALSRGMSALETALAVSAIHASLVPLLFGLFEFIEYSRRYRDRVVSKILTYAFDKSQEFRNEASKRVIEFERRIGQVGFGIGIVGFSFLLGNVWASAGAYLLNLKKATIIASIAIGAVLSSIFWTLAFLGVVGFLPSPWALYALLMSATFLLLAYKKVRERKLCRKIFDALLKELKR